MASWSGSIKRAMGRVHTTWAGIIKHLLDRTSPYIIFIWSCKVILGLGFASPNITLPDQINMILVSVLSNKCIIYYFPVDDVIIEIFSKYFCNDGGKHFPSTRCVCIFLLFREFKSTLSLFINSLRPIFSSSTCCCVRGLFLMCFRKLLEIASKIQNHFRKRPCGKPKSLFATSQVLNFPFSTRSSTKFKFLFAMYLLKIGYF